MADNLGKGNAIRNIINNPDWMIIEDMLKLEYMDALRTLIEKEDEVARSTIKAIDILYAKITNGLRMADIARAELSKKLK